MQNKFLILQVNIGAQIEIIFVTKNSKSYHQNYQEPKRHYPDKNNIHVDSTNRNSGNWR